jgi:hypothetical protein
VEETSRSQINDNFILSHQSASMINKIYKENEQRHGQNSQESFHKRRIIQFELRHETVGRGNED